MVHVSIGTHPKFARLSDQEFRAHVVGVLAVAARAIPRGRLLVGSLPAEPGDIAVAAGVSERVAVSTLEKLTALGVLEVDEEQGCLRVHDWDEFNPQPSTSRVRAHRARKALQGNADETREALQGNANETHEVKRSKELPSEVQKTALSSLRLDVDKCFAYWQAQCGHPTAKLTDERRRRIEARRRQGYTVEQICEAIDGAATAAFIDDNGHRFDDIELICRNGSKLEAFIARRTDQPRPGVGQRTRESAGDLIRAINESEGT